MSGKGSKRRVEDFRRVQDNWPDLSKKNNMAIAVTEEERPMFNFIEAEVETKPTTESETGATRNSIE